MSEPSLQGSTTRLRAILANEGLRSAVIYVNSLSSHRFTALYKFEGQTLRSLTFYDRENPAITFSDEIPIWASYCVFVRDSQQTYRIDHAAEDERLGDHPKRRTIQTYCGVPLMDRSGKMVGTVCHFDVKAGGVRPTEVAMLELLAKVLRKTL